jgi:hypothetical protein
MAERSDTAAVVSAILNKIEAEIDDRRTLPSERGGLRIAHVIVRTTATEMGVSYE